MYAFLKGKIVDKKENLLIVENNGIGYELVVSNNTLSAIDEINKDVKIYTYYYFKEDMINLFGFYKEQEKNMFLKLIKVNGVGPKMAITILSGVSLSDLAISIVNGDITALNSIKGVGKKTAERILLELKEKIDIDESEVLIGAGGIAADGNNDSAKDAINALVGLGIGKTDAYKIVKKVYVSGDTAEQVIEKALKSFNK